MEPNQIQKKPNSTLMSSIVIIIIVLIIGGIYFWKTNQEEKIETPNSDLAADDTARIEAELNNMDLDSLDEGI
ncbi:hypothetical protein A2738_03520 [Candidatus Nomurabacteria bacterium RIFCSPHIGHO2_01_FULL_42_15]|uniref:Uncharacterized protein n=1 Tax=Candidatus Nomurabacteria bacterium RIFCSPHIGHO2_01_FULL_42_15 TaxID=1801742 RepID=A0A1F6VGD7_9BACT|nr:MAG: hypothetical protein A2738_03520 [Candidatus Nomurabacteria bacterium RIFCSPHIGHO2_01_FULL_42_15]OGI92747.1 MAG: hypothetical protein A3A99_02585 [Candidatus Nomurabacteria bacterium RIFCSPLOWO2_01_FULL_41_18]